MPHGMYQWQGHPGDAGPQGDCPAVSPGAGEWGWLCTLTAGHGGLHEAWGTSGIEPIYAWGHVKEEKPEMQYVAEKDYLHVKVDSDDGMAALSRMLDEALAEAQQEREGDVE